MNTLERIERGVNSGTINNINMHLPNNHTRLYALNNAYKRKYNNLYRRVHGREPPSFVDRQYAKLIKIEEKLNRPFFTSLLASNKTLQQIYKKNILNSKRLKAYTKNANYRALHNRVEAKLLPIINVEPIRHRRQEGGTCWFHSIVNGLLLSHRPRSILKIMSERVPTEPGYNFRLCPMRNAPNILFWKYIKHRLEGYGGVNSAYKNINVIKSVIRRSVRQIAKTQGVVTASQMYFHRTEGGIKQDVYNFYKKMFPKNLFILRDYKNGPIPHTAPGGYTLTHADISIYPEEGAHAMAGYLTRNGNYKIYDSAADDVINYDWTKHNSEPLAKRMEITAIYTKD